MQIFHRAQRAGRFTLGGILLAVLWFGPASDITAQSRYPVKVTNVRVGLPPGPFSKKQDDAGKPAYLFKAAAWAPVWVDLEVTAKIDLPEIEISIETADGEDVISSARIVVSTPQPGNISGYALGRLPYLKPGDVHTDVKVYVREAVSGKPFEGKQLAESYSRYLDGMQPAQHLILSVGSTLPGLRLPKADGKQGEDADNDILRNGWVELAEITNVRELPDQWFGYSAVDLMIVATGARPEFFHALANDPKRRAALREWVRRGGRIVIAAGANGDLLMSDALPEFKEMLPAKLIAGKRFADEIPLTFPNTPRLLLKPPAGGTIAVQKFEGLPQRPFQLKLSTEEEAKKSSPLVVQAAFGMGRVTFVAFDLDVVPLVDWRYRDVFWEWLINTSSTRLPSGADRVGPAYITNDEEDKYLTRMQNNLDFFEGIPVISFGWVALFILAYIVLIGPVEYYFLKRVLKRLEWTWVTFPIIVVTVSAAAYFAAYELKGREMKINKIDLVDVDLQSNRIFGETWFTIFSPRIQNYNIGVEPVGPRPEEPELKTWVSDGVDKTLPDTLVSWHGRAKNIRQSLFRRTYYYHSSTEPDASGRQPFADGLEQVPIQVWSTKSFTANWTARTDPLRPIFTSTLRIASADESNLTGSITSHLPVDSLVDAQLFYRDRVTLLPNLNRGMERFVSTTSDQAATATSWLFDANKQKDLFPSRGAVRGGRNDAEDDPTFRLWPVLFHDLMAGQHGRLYNASLREFDQSWRVQKDSTHEAILIARIGRAEGPAETMSNSPSAPTRLWLSELPGSGSRTSLQGTLRQETYVRVFIPVMTAKP